VVAGRAGNEFSQELISRSGYEREGFASHYDRYRPKPPAALFETLLQLARTERPALVVDLGAGTGLSTRPWAPLAKRVVGVEPNASMGDAAEGLTREPNVEFVLGFSHETGLADACADIVTASQSLHWMEPAPTFREVGRILQPGGLFAAYDYDVYPVVDWEIEQALWEYGARRRARRERLGIHPGAERLSKDGHLGRMRDSGEFRFCRELVLHSVEEGDVDRIVGLMGSIGMIGDPEEAERELRLDEVEAVARRVLGDRTVPFRFGYHVRVGVR
jgi:SAM-dependent methyltransferase